MTVRLCLSVVSAVATSTLNVYSAQGAAVSHDASLTRVGLIVQTYWGETVVV